MFLLLYIERKALITKTKKKKTKKRTRRDETKRQPVVAQIQKYKDIIRCLCVCVCVCGNDSHYFISHGYILYDGNATFYSRFTSRFTIIIIG